MTQKSDVFQAGDEIEVLSTWAHGSQRWKNGYSFVRYDGPNVIVRLDKGTFQGSNVRHSMRDVRHSTTL